VTRERALSTLRSIVCIHSEALAADNPWAADALQDAHADLTGLINQIYDHFDWESQSALSNTEIT